MLKRVTGYLFGLVALLILVLLVAPFFIDANSFRPQIAKAVENATGRSLQIGNIEASLFPWVGLRLDGITLSNRAGFSDNPFLKAENLDVRVALLPLLKQQLVIDQFLLESPEIFLERISSGMTNWQGSTSDTYSEPTTPLTDNTRTEPENVKSKPSDRSQSTTFLASLNAESLQVNQGRVVWSDQVSGEKMEITDIRVTVTDLQLERPVSLALSAHVGPDQVNVDGQFGPVGDLGKLDARKLPVQLQLKSNSLHLKTFSQWIPEMPELVGKRDEASLSLDLQAEQRPDGKLVSAGSMALSAAIDAGLNYRIEMPFDDRLNLHDLNATVDGKQILKAQGELKLGDEFRYQIRMKSDPVSRSWLESTLPALNGLYQSHPSPWQTARLGALISGNGEKVELRDVQLAVDQELIQISGSMTMSSDPDLQLRIRCQELHLDPLMPKSEEEVQPANSVDSELSRVADQPAEPDLRAFGRWKVDSDLSIDRLYVSNIEISNLRASVKGSRGLFRLNPLSFNIDSGEVSDRTTLDVSRYPVGWNESVTIRGVRIGPLLGNLADLDMIDGRVDFDAELKGSGLIPKTVVSTLNGRGKVDLHDGSVKGFDIAGAMRNLKNLGSGSDSKRTDFAQLTGGFVIENGIVRNDDLFMVSPLFRLTGHGVLNLPNGSMDYHVKPRLVGSLTGQGDTLKVRKGLSVPLRIRGSFSSPKVSFEGDPKSLIEELRSIDAGQAKEAVRDAKERLDDLKENPLKLKKIDPALEQKARKNLKKLLPGF